MNATGCTCPMPRLSSDKPFQHEPGCPVLGQIGVASSDKTPEETTLAGRLALMIEQDRAG